MPQTGCWVRQFPEPHFQRRRYNGHTNIDRLYHAQILVSTGSAAGETTKLKSPENGCAYRKSHLGQDAPNAYRPQNQMFLSFPGDNNREAREVHADFRRKSSSFATAVPACVCGSSSESVGEPLSTPLSVWARVDELSKSGTGGSPCVLANDDFRFDDMRHGCGTRDAPTGRAAIYTRGAGGWVASCAASDSQLRSPAGLKPRRTLIRTLSKASQSSVRFMDLNRQYWNPLKLSVLA